MSSLAQTDKQSKYTLRCPFCRSKVISSQPPRPIYTAQPPPDRAEFSFVNVTESLGVESSAPDQPVQFYLVGSMWDFDNIGVSRPSSTINVEMSPIEPETQTLSLELARFLTCADCDKGPLGFAAQQHNTDTTQPQTGETLTYFLATNSCIYDN
ncbi:hypothetical protein OGAPHI_004623 [Ogataea philodendri]|uniref:Uncharacterized protein n=1 Tax=Ogataea philodendri TaxID=1378263 RepID=A0A9P8P3C2_9ASCO|nr:uncharacterized protein OGAPHI_004623 [Ogataea philodendri]KAH3664271.1 hypothetical protein OGAPHI_004623 [Ogataea philodendri]